MQDYEKLGAFYLGKTYHLETRSRSEELLLYDSKDLTTHAVIIGMTGSGKTGLGIGILEEALIDHIPIIAIDPKGDLSNLLLNFPQLQAADFRPWINEQDALAAGLSPEQYAQKQAQLWRNGLAQWGQSPERIARLQAAADCTVFTPGSSAGQAVCVLRSFAPPPEIIRKDTDLLRERIQTTTTSLLALLDIVADPITSREHILIANILETTWMAGKTLDLAGLIHTIQSPPFERVGILDLEAFYPAQERFQLAMRLNNLLAAPGFEVWLEGTPLNVGHMLYTDHGKPRASIFSIAHLTDTERMFFVAMLLNEILAWIRTQPGTTSLRAVLYMDEIFGYFPPVKNPPSKAPLLTLLKQARAYGLGVVLSTQNPVDLDYKGLANTGSWFIGRLQTDRDKRRVIEGLEGAAAGSGFDRGRMEEILAGLGKRVFLLNNVHENTPVTFESRWVLSYLSGPLTREQIKLLKAGQQTATLNLPAPTESAVRPTSQAAAPERVPTAPPVVPPEIESLFLPASGAGQGLVYYPAMAGWVDVHYSSTKYRVDMTRHLALATPLDEGPVPVDWDQAEEIGLAPAEVDTAPLAGAAYGELPTVAKDIRAHRKWRKDFLRWIRQNRPLRLYKCGRSKLISAPQEGKSEFMARLALVLREKRDLAVGKLRRKYNHKFTTLNQRLMRAQQVILREQEQAQSKKMETVISFGTAILGAFLGRKAVSSSSVGRMGSAMKSASRMQREKMDVVRAQERAEAVRQQMTALDEQLQADIAKLDERLDPGEEELREILVKPKVADLTLELFSLVWMPYRRDAQGRQHSDWTTP